jgi:hypothetical protein
MWVWAFYIARVLGESFECGGGDGIKGRAWWRVVEYGGLGC